MIQASSSSHTMNSLSATKHRSAPNELYPVVQDLSEAELANGSLCGETFGPFQLSDLVSPAAVPSASIWNALCNPKSPRVMETPLKKSPTESNDNGDRQVTANGNCGSTTELQDYHDRVNTPCKPKALTQRDSSDSFPLHCSMTRDDPQSLQEMLDADASSDSNQEIGDQSGLVSELPHCDDGEYDGNSSTEVILKEHVCSSNSEKQQHQEQPTKSGRKHLRRKSQQLFNMLMAMSPTSSSNRDLSTADTMADSYHVRSAVEDNEQRKFEDHYVLVRQMFKCRYSELWECVNKATGASFCVKILERADQTELEMLRAITNFSGGHPHPNIVVLVEAFEHDSKLYAVMEMEGINLLTKVVKEGAMKEADVKQLTRSLLHGLCFVHAKSIVHKNMQPDNILFAMAEDRSSSVKIADFGCAVNFEWDHRQRKTESVSLYSAPEVIAGVKSCDASADMWSLGCLVYFMLSGSSPFDGSSETTATRRSKILRAEYSFQDGTFADISRGAKQFIAALIHVDESVRLTAAEALDHHWFYDAGQLPTRVRPFELDSTWDNSPSAHRHRDVSSLQTTPPRNLASSHRHRHVSSSDSSNQLRGTSPFRGISPKRTSSSKHHHRRLTSIGKGLTKLFFAKEHEAKESVIKETSSCGALTLPQSSPARSVSSGKHGRRSERHRRQLTE